MSTNFRVEQILFPIDFSPASQAAAAYIAGFAKEISARVSLLHVIAWLPEWHGVSESYYPDSQAVAPQDLREQRAASERAACRALEEFKARHFPGAAVTGCIKSGGVSESIVEQAADVSADWVMMPTRGLGPLRRFLIGSTTAKVLHDLHRPLWTTPHARELGPFSPWRHIVCAMDYRAMTSSLLLRAKEIAATFSSRLTIVSAIPDVRPSTFAAHEKSAGPMRREVATNLEAMCSELGMHPAIEVFEGSVGEVVREGALLEEADLIVIGQGHLDEPMGHLRTHAYEIIWNAPCPVLKA